MKTQKRLSASSAWTRDERATLRHLAEEGYTEHQAARELGKSAHSTRLQAGRLHLDLRKSGSVGYGQWLTANVDILRRRVGRLDGSAAAYRGKNGAALLAAKADANRQYLGRLTNCMDKWQEHLGAVAAEIEKRLLGIKERLRNLEGRLRKKKGLWWKAALGVVKKSVDILGLLIKLAQVIQGLAKVSGPIMAMVAALLA